MRTTSARATSSQAETAQNLTTPLGKMLRIDPLNPAA